MKDGTFAQYIVSQVAHLTLIPDSLPSPDATTIMCAGATVYASLMQCGAKIGDWVVLSGAGGGLGHLGMNNILSILLSH